MQTSRFHTITARFSPMNIRTSFRRSSSASSQSSRASSSNRSVRSFAPSGDRLLGLGSGSVSSGHGAISPVSVSINSIVFRQPAAVDAEEERRSFGTELVGILEPRPVVCWASLDEKMGTF